MNLRFSLVGAHFAGTEAAQGERLDVDIRLAAPSVRLGPLRAAVTGTVRAEGFARGAPCVGVVRVGVSGAEWSLDFLADDASPLTLAFCQRFVLPLTLRSLTELSGWLTAGPDGRVRRRVRLRFDARRALGR